MCAATQRIQERPFHETIVNAIQRCSSPSSGEILRLFRLITETRIRKNHDQIILAIDKFFDFPGAGKWAREIREVKEAILGQKKVSAKKSVGKKKSVRLDDLQQETEKLLAILTIVSPV